MAILEGIWEEWPFEYPPDYSGDWRAQFNQELELIQELIDNSNELPSDKIIGGILRFQVADGYAWYIVTREKPLTIAWLPIGDEYEIPDAHIRGLNREDVAGQIAFLRGISKIFGGKK